MITRISISLAVMLCTLGCSTKSSTKISVPAGASVQYGDYSTGTKVAVGPPLSNTLITKLNAEPDNAEKNAAMGLKTRTYLHVNGMTLQVNGNELLLLDGWGVRTWIIKGIETKLEALITKAPNKPDAGDEKQIPSPIEATTESSELLRNLQGEWVVVSSTGKPDSGHVFLPLVKKTAIQITADTMSWVKRDGWDGQNRDQWIRISKRIVPQPDVSSLAVNLDPDFPKYKTWSRVAIVRSRGNEIDLCVTFPQGPRPTRFTGADDGSECVLLRRVRTKEDVMLTATAASIQVVQTWQDLLNQPPTSVGTGTARLGIEARRSPYRSGILLYCLTDGYSPPQEWKERCRLGPFKVEIQHEQDTRERIQKGVAMVRRAPPDIARSTALFRCSIHLDRPGKFLVRVLTLDGDLIAETEVVATRKEFHPWMPLQPVSGQAQVLERDRIGYDAVAHVANRAKGIAIPRFDGLAPMLFSNDGPEATVRKPADEKLPALLPVDAGSALTIEATAADLVIESKQNIVLARPDWHFLVRWWVNGKAYIPDQLLEAFKDENGMVVMGKKLLLHLDFVPHRIGAKAGDEIELQLLYCKHGWELVQSDMEMLSAHSRMAGPELLLSNRTRIDWEKNKNRQQIAPADADKPRH